MTNSGAIEPTLCPDVYKGCDHVMVMDSDGAGIACRGYIQETHSEA